MAESAESQEGSEELKEDIEMLREHVTGSEEASPAEPSESESVAREPDEPTDSPRKPGVEDESALEELERRIDQVRDNQTQLIQIIREVRQKNAQQDSMADIDLSTVAEELAGIRDKIKSMEEKGTSTPISPRDIQEEVIEVAEEVRKELRGDISSLMKYHTKLESRVKQLEDNSPAGLEDKMMEYRRDLEDVSERMERMDQEWRSRLDDLREDVDKTRENLREEIREIEEMGGEVDIDEGRLKDAVGDVFDDVNSRILQVNRDLSREIDELKHTADQLKRDVRGLKVSSDDTISRSELVSLKRRVKDLSDLVVELLNSEGESSS